MRCSKLVAELLDAFLTPTTPSYCVTGSSKFIHECPAKPRRAASEPDSFRSHESGYYMLSDSLAISSAHVLQLCFFLFHPFSHDNIKERGKKYSEQRHGNHTKENDGSEGLSHFCTWARGKG